MTILACLLLALPQTAEKPIDPAAQSGGGGRVSARAQVSKELTDSFQDDQRVRDAFRTEVDKPAYRRLRTKLKQFQRPNIDVDIPRPNFIGRFFSWIGRTLRRWFGGTPGGATQSGGGFSFSGMQGGQVLLWCVLAVGLAILVAFIVKSAAVRVGNDGDRKKFAAQVDSDAIQPSTPPGEIPSDEYMHRALELAREGDHRRALRQLVLGGMSWIERAGLIRFRKGLTNRDYIRAVYRREQQRRRFAGIILDFEKVYFGRREAGEEQFQECLADYQDAFGQPLDPETAAREDENRRTKANRATARPQAKRNEGNTGLIEEEVIELLESDIASEPEEQS